MLEQQTNYSDLERFVKLKNLRFNIRFTPDVEPDPVPASMIPAEKKRTVTLRRPSSVCLLNFQRIPTGIPGGISQFRLDAQELVVLRHAI